MNKVDKHLKAALTQLLAEKKELDERITAAQRALGTQQIAVAHAPRPTIKRRRAVSTAKVKAALIARKRPIKVAAFAKAVGLTPHAASNALARLAKAGAAKRVKKGYYQATGKKEAA